MNGRRLGHAADVPEGEARGFDPGGTGQDSVLVVRLDGALYAWRDACPHYGDTAMAWRKDAYLNRDGTRIVCAAHGAQFDIRTGACTLGPCLGQSLTPVPITVSADGAIDIVTGVDLVGAHDTGRPRA